MPVSTSAKPWLALTWRVAVTSGDRELSWEGAVRECEEKLRYLLTREVYGPRP